MATKELMTRIQSKIATLAEWKAVESTFKPLRGEICIAEIPANDATASTSPTCLIKIGTGTDFFKDLTWLSARSADVQNFLKVNVDENSENKGAAWTQADFETWIKSLVDVTDIDLSAYVKAADVAAVHAQVETNKTDIANLTSDLADANTEIGKNTTAITNLTTTHGNDKTELEGKITAAQNAADAAQGDIDAYIESNDAALDVVRTNAQKGVDDAATAQAAAEAAQGDVDELSATVADLGNVYDAKGAAATAESNAKGYTDELANGAVAQNTAAIATLNGSAAQDGSVAKQVNDAINEFATKVTGDNQTYDTFKELVDYVAEHGGEAAEMASAIEILEGKMTDAEGDIDALQTKMNTIEENSEKNVIETVKVNGVALTPDADRAVDVTVPTGALASKDKVAKTDLDTALASELDAKATTEALNGAIGRIADLEAVEAEKNVIVEVQLNGTKITPDSNRAVNIELGDLASKDKVAKADLDNALATELDAKATTQALTDGLALKADKSAYDQTVADLDAAEEKIAAFEERFGSASDVLIFNCGSSTVNV